MTSWPNFGFLVIILGFAACRPLHFDLFSAREQEITAKDLSLAVNMGYRHPLTGEVRLQAVLLAITA